MIQQNFQSVSEILTENNISIYYIGSGHWGDGLALNRHQAIIQASKFVKCFW